MLVASVALLCGASACSAIEGFDGLVPDGVADAGAAADDTGAGCVGCASSGDDSGSGVSGNGTDSGGVGVSTNDGGASTDAGSGGGKDSGSKDSGSKDSGSKDSGSTGIELGHHRRRHGRRVPLRRDDGRFVRELRGRDPAVHCLRQRGRHGRVLRRDRPDVPRQLPRWALHERMPVHDGVAVHARRPGLPRRHVLPHVRRGAVVGRSVQDGRHVHRQHVSVTPSPTE